MNPPISSPAIKIVKSVREQVSAEEWQTRVDLAACYRLVALYGYTEGIANHISARVPGTHDQFLLNPYGLLYEEMDASSLIKVDLEGNVLFNATDLAVNTAGFVIHSAVHMARPDAGCVIHLHTPDGMAVSALGEGLLPLNQTAMLVIDDLAFHDYEGVALELDERERLQADLGARHWMLLRNHGTLAVGRNVADAFNRMYLLERACTAQVRTLSMGRPLHLPQAEVVAKVGQQVTPEGLDTSARTLVWPAVLRKLDRIDPSYKD